MAVGKWPEQTVATQFVGFSEHFRLPKNRVRTVEPIIL